MTTGRTIVIWRVVRFALHPDRALIRLGYSCLRVEAERICLMRISLTALALQRTACCSFDLPIRVKIRSTRGFSGELSYETDTFRLSKLLRLKTELPGGVIDRFISDLRVRSSADLQNLHVSETTMREIGGTLD
jgi:hypothetical protein